MKLWPASLSAALALVALSSCGNDTTESPLVSIGRALVVRGEEAPAPPPDVLAQVALSSLKGPLLLAELEGADAVAVLGPFGQNGAVTTWSTEEFQTVSLEGPLVVATRGLGNDLMTVSQRGGARTYHLMDAANDPVTITVTCAIRAEPSAPAKIAGGKVISASRVSESCQGDGVEFTNTYWTKTDGVIRRSRQWLGPKTGYVELHRLR